MSLTEEADKKDHRVLIFGALSLFLATLEYLIPKPIPFFRFGLANIPLLLALPVFSLRQIVILSAIKIIGQAIIGGTLTSYVLLFSFASTLVSTLVMWSFFKLARPYMSFVGLSLLGSTASNLVQIWLSIAYVFGQSATIFAPLLMVFGLAAGLITGLIANWLARTSLWYQDLLATSDPKPSLPYGLKIMGLGPRPPTTTGNEANADKRRKKIRLVFPERFNFMAKILSPRAQGFMGLACLILFLFTNNIYVRIAETLLWVLLAMSAQKKLQPLYFVSMIGLITFFHLFLPAGEVYVEVLGLSVTEGGLRNGLLQAFMIVGQVFISLATIRPDLRLPGNFGSKLAQVLFLYQSLFSNRRTIKFGQIPAYLDDSIDDLQTRLKVWSARAPEASHTSLKGYLFMGLLVALHGVFFVLCLKTQA